MSARVQTGWSLSGTFLAVACLWELVFNRVASAAGFYGGVGATGVASALALSGRFAMNAAGIMALALTCIELPRIAGSPRRAALPIRLALMLASPFYLPVLCVSIFRPVQGRLVLIAYLFAVGSTLLVALLVAFRSRRRAAAGTVLLLGLMEALGALDLLARYSRLLYSVPAPLAGALPRVAYLASEVLFVACPVIAFFAFLPVRVRDFWRRPPLLPLLAALAATAIAAAVAAHASGGEFLRSISYRTLGVTLFIPGGPVLYLASLFLGALVAGSLVLPFRRWTAAPGSIDAGIGLACILMVGVQPTHPYQFAILIAGFFQLARGLAVEAPPPAAPAAPIPS